MKAILAINPFQTVSLGFMVVVLMVASGCGSSEPVVQIRNLRYIQLMQAAVSSRDATKVDKVISSAQRQQQAGALGEDELAILMEIGILAANDKWAEAEQACHRLAEGQQWRRRG